MAVLVDAKQGSGSVDPLVGKVIHDRFRIISPIARGGMGAVYKAEQAPLGRLVAIKVLSPKHDEEKDPEFRKRFFLEAATVAKLSHPNTVTVFDYGQSDGLYFIVMELLDGVTLKKALRTDGYFPPERAIHITKQICRSLREAHRLGIIHRDMKPGNVMLLEQGDEKDYAKVLDFGLVKDTEASEEEDLTQAGVFMGSPKYMSPEQIQGERVDQRSDIYSVGIIFYEMLTGSPPFMREKQVQILMDHINAPVPPLTPPAGAPPIPEEVAQVVMKCLAKKRDDRFADMDQFLQALKGVAGELMYQLPASGELGTSGEIHLGRTPVSGVHTLAADALRQSSSGAIRASITGAPAYGAPSDTPPTVSGAVALPEITRPEDTGKTSPWLTAGLAVFALAVVAAIAVVVINPFANEETASASTERTQAPPPAQPEVPAVQPSEPAVQPPPQQPATIRSVILELDSQPPGAMVHIGDAQYGPTPAQVEITGPNTEPGAQITFVFRQEGFREFTVTRTVPASGPIEVTARMRRIGATVVRTGPREESGEPAAEERTPAGYRESPY